MSEISVIPQTCLNGRTFLKIDIPMSKLHEGDYIVINETKYYIQLPQSDSNYRLYMDNNFTVDGFIGILAQGRQHLYITNTKQFHKEFLMSQWKERIKQYLPVKSYSS